MANVKAVVLTIGAGKALLMYAGVPAFDGIAHKACLSSSDASTYTDLFRTYGRAGFFIGLKDLIFPEPNIVVATSPGIIEVFQRLVLVEIDARGNSRVEEGGSSLVLRSIVVEERTDDGVPLVLPFQVEADFMHIREEALIAARKIRILTP